MTSNTICLFANSNWQGPVNLRYRRQEALSQKRFEGRECWAPEIDLKLFKCTAVVDWIELTVEFSRKTQHRWVNKVILEVTGRKEYVEARNPDEGGSAQIFVIRFQEPDFSLIRKAMNELDRVKGICSPEQINQIEVSIDFTPKVPSAVSRGLMHGVIMRHFCPPSNTLETSHDWPRFSLPEGTTGFFRRRRSGEFAFDTRRFPFKDETVRYEATVYIGRKNSPRFSWRIQNKVIDSQNRDAGTLVALEEEQKRIRIEVTVGPEGCSELGLRNFSDMAALNFPRLQRQLFNFELPTFPTEATCAARKHVAVARYLNELARDRFLGLGIMGLQVMDEAQDEFEKAHLPALKKSLQLSKRRVPQRRRSLVRATGNFVAYRELNHMARYALTHLQGRVRVGMGK